LRDKLQYVIMLIKKVDDLLNGICSRKDKIFNCTERAAILICKEKLRYQFFMLVFSGDLNESGRQLYIRRYFPPPHPTYREGGAEVKKSRSA